MGYDVEMEMCGVAIPADKVAGAITALKELMACVQERGRGGTFAPGKEPVRHYSWVRTAIANEALEKEDLPAFFDEWRYDAAWEDSLSPVEQLVTGKDYSTVHISFFSSSKWGDEEKLWSALAPFIEEGATIECRGEDGTLWRYLFTGGEMVEQSGKIVWG
tara:strand:+ start:824 stop:1306 length:483 start_codon:yes stop_codon:yes gene_type:complete